MPKHVIDLRALKAKRQKHEDASVEVDKREERVEEQKKEVPEPVSAQAAPEEAIIITDPIEEKTEQFWSSGQGNGSETVDARDMGAPPTLRFWQREGPPSVWWGVASGGAVLLVFVLLLSTVFARVTVSVKPRVENLALEGITVALSTAASRVEFLQKVIPAERLEFLQTFSEEFDATGTKMVEEKARGKALLFNQFSSSPQTLREGTRFTADSGMIFRIAKAVVIPGAKIVEGKITPQSVEVELVADKAGEEQNITREITLRIVNFKGTPKYDGFYAIAKEGLTGGFKGEARVVTKEDISRAQSAFTEKMQTVLAAELQKKVPPGFTLVEAFRMIDVVKTQAPAPNTRAERFTVTREARARAFIFRKEDVVAFLRETLLTEKEHQAFVEDSEELIFRARSIDFDNGRVEAAIEGSIKVKAVLPSEDLARLVKGKKEGSIVQALKSREEVADFSLSFFPPWLFSAPENEKKIRLVIENP